MKTFDDYLNILISATNNSLGTSYTSQTFSSTNIYQLYYPVIQLLISRDADYAASSEELVVASDNGRGSIEKCLSVLQGAGINAQIGISNYGSGFAYYFFYDGSTDINSVGELLYENVPAPVYFPMNYGSQTGIFSPTDHITYHINTFIPQTASLTLHSSNTADQSELERLFLNRVYYGRPIKPSDDFAPAQDYYWTITVGSNNYNTFYSTPIENMVTITSVSQGSL